MISILFNEMRYFTRSKFSDSHAENKIVSKTDGRTEGAVILDVYFFQKLFNI